MGEQIAVSDAETQCIEGTIGEAFARNVCWIDRVASV